MREPTFLNRYLSLEISSSCTSRTERCSGVVMAVLALNLPWWASQLLLPIVLFSVAGWIYEARIVLPLATRLWRGEPKEQRTGNKEQDWNREPRSENRDG